MGLTTRALALFPIASVIALSFAISCSSAYGEDDADAGSTVESGVDAGLTPDAPGDAPAGDALVRFCVGAEAIFCDDFDNGSLGQTWTGTQISDGGTLALVSSTESPPNALLAAVRGQSGSVEAGPGSYREATLLKNLALSALAGAALDFDLRIDQVPSDTNAVSVIASISFDFDKHSVSLLALPNNGLGLFIADPSLDGGSSNTAVQRPPGTGFFHVRLETSFAGTGTKVVVNGVQTASADGLTPSGGGFFVAVGAVVLNTVEETKIAYDNVVVTGL